MQKQKKILIVEDEKTLRDALMDALARKSYLPVVAKNGREGVDLALKERPDLILLDLIMEEMDGMAALKKIRENAWGAKVPVIILTNLSTMNANMIDDAWTHRPTQYMIKSDWKLSDIIKKIDELLKLKQQA